MRRTLFKKHRKYPKLFCYKPGWILLVLLLIASCKKEDDPPQEVVGGHITLEVHHKINGQELIKNQWLYVNMAGNSYQVTDVMYFISDICFYKTGGTYTMIRNQKEIFYINDEEPSTMSIALSDLIPPGSYDSVSFIFGIDSVKNKSNRFVNPPEVIMAWPEVLGGGYHYMMINGKWKDTSGLEQPYNLHLGIGQLYHGTTYHTDSIYAYVQNYFRVTLPESSFSINKNESLTFRLTMNLDRWFSTPHVFDLNYWGGAIMQNQAAMQVLKENGPFVFSWSQAR
jgi:hypothetical protein